MQADPNPNDGDLAAIYASTQSNFTEDTQTQFITFPEAVTLPNSIGEDYAEIQLQAVDESIMLDCFGNLNSERFNVDIYIELDGDYKNYRIQYESSDGLNYTRTIFESGEEPLENPVDLTTLVKWGSRWGETQWNDLVGYFMIVGSSTYEGLYEYNGTNTQYELANTQLNTTSEDIYGNKVLYTNIGKITGTLQNTDNLTLDQLKTRVNLYNDLSYLELNENITNISTLFQSSHLTNIPNFDTSNFTDMSSMFFYCNNLLTVPNFNTSRVTSMSSMFTYCNNLLIVPNFNTSKVTSMSSMFNGCTNLINIPNFNTGNVVYMRAMLLNCTNLVNIPQLDISNAKDIGYMFLNCTNLVSIPELNMANVTDILYTFAYCNNLSNESYANIANSLPLAINLNGGCRLNRSNLNIDRFTSEQLKILGNKGYIEGIPSIINGSNVSTYWNIQLGSTWNNVLKANYDVDGTTLSKSITSSSSITTVNIYDYGNEGTLYYASYLFYNKPYLTSINLNNLKLDKLKLTDCMFLNCQRLINVPNFDTSNVINMYRMFFNCTNINTTPNFDTSNVINMSGMFQYCWNLISLPNYDTSNVRDMGYMFEYCQRLTTIPNFNTSNVVTMRGMFQTTYHLNTVPNFNTSNVRDMSEMFINSFGLTDVPNFDTSKVTNMQRMFVGCFNLVNVPQFNTSNVNIMQMLFYNCTNLTNIPNFDTSNVTTMESMFSGCNNLVNIPEFNTNNVTNISYMFYNCNNLSNSAIQNIINMCLNSNIINATLMNLSNTNQFSPLYNTKFDNSYYQNRWSELTSAGWSY